MNFRTGIHLLSASTLLLHNAISFAWGANGHKIVGLIAEKHLTPEVRKKVEEILSEDDTFTHTNKKHPLADISTWADTIKKKPEGAGTGPWHFTDMDSSVTRETADLAAYCAHSDSCSLLKAKSFLVELGSVELKKADKARALKFYDHLVGDIHQPMHNIGWKDANGVSDAGGNLRAVFFFKDKDPFYGTRRGILNLHGIWDTNIITHMMQERGIVAPEQLNQDVAAQGQVVVDNLDDLNSTKLERFADEVDKILETAVPPATLDPLDWGWEAHAYAKSTSYGEGLVAQVDIFKTLIENKLLAWSDTQTDAANRTNLTPARDELASDKPMNIKYYTASSKIVGQQLAFAGLRLAETLNAALKE